MSGSAKPVFAHPGWKRTLVDAFILAVACSILGFVANEANPKGIPLIAREAYETLVPCPEPGGDVEALAATDPVLEDAGNFFVDARPADEAALWSYGGAVNVPYDYLDTTPEDVLRDLARSIAGSGARRVVVYGDGDDPDTGEQLGREISGHGIRNVHFVTGGAPALRAATGEAAP